MGEAGEIPPLPCPQRSLIPIFLSTPFVRIKVWGVRRETNWIQVHPVTSCVATFHTVIPHLEM